MRSAAHNNVSCLKREDCQTEGLRYTAEVLYPRYMDYFGMVWKMEQPVDLGAGPSLRLATAYTGQQKYGDAFKTLKSIDESSLTEAQIYLRSHLFAVCSYHIKRSRFGKEMCIKAIIMNGSMLATDKANLQCYLRAEMMEPNLTSPAGFKMVGASALKTTTS